MPERWLGKGAPEQAWLTFGAGQRQCVGQGLAVQELKVWIAQQHTCRHSAARLAAA